MAIDTDYQGLLIDGKYLLQEKVGAGAMSVIYRGINQKNDKPVAIKIMRRSHAEDEEFIARFNREIHTSLSLTHKNIIKVYAGGTLSTKELYLVMELLEGKSLEAVLQEQKSLPVPRALNLILQAAEGLAVAHKRGYIHRDIKPDNLMLVKGLFNSDCIKVLDFGVAKLNDTVGFNDKFATAPGDVLGSPLYMSPEQVLGQRVDARADIYSLGCVLYECICGTPAIAGSNAIEIMKNQLEWKPPHINYYLQKKQPNELNDLIQRAIVKLPEDRYASMSEFAEAIRNYSTPAILVKFMSMAKNVMPGNGDSASHRNRGQKRKASR